MVDKEPDILNNPNTDNEPEPPCVWDREEKTKARIEWDQRPEEYKEIVEEVKRKRAIEERKRLKETLGIDVDDYEKYFKVMAKNDIQVKGHMGVLRTAFRERLKRDVRKRAFDLYADSFDKMRNLYEGIDTTELNEDTGREIIEKFKLLVEKCAVELEKLKADFCDTSQPLPKEPPELAALMEDMKGLADRYESLPAYISYRNVGVYELDRKDVPESRQIY